jgi:prepilin-type N-terminal cleavage/methylation domain-containing protein
VKRGFTLMEVLLALLLLALLLSLVQGAYSGAVRSRERSRVETEEAHLAAVVLQKIAGELSMAVHLPGSDAAGFIVEGEGDGVSNLSFVTRVPRISGFSLGGAALVDYALEEGEEGTSSLVRRETPDWC